MDNYVEPSYAAFQMKTGAHRYLIFLLEARIVVFLFFFAIGKLFATICYRAGQQMFINIGNDVKKNKRKKFQYLSNELVVLKWKMSANKTIPTQFGYVLRTYGDVSLSRDNANEKKIKRKIRVGMNYTDQWNEYTNSRILRDDVNVKVPNLGKSVLQYLPR